MSSVWRPHPPGRPPISGPGTPRPAPRPCRTAAPLESYFTLRIAPTRAGDEKFVRLVRLLQHATLLTTKSRGTGIKYRSLV